MKKISLLIFLFSAALSFAQKEDSLVFSKISTEILVKGKSYEDLRDLTKNIGHRLSGSQAYEKSVVWAAQKLREAGADKVWLQEVSVPVWIRGKESLHIKTGNGKWKKINFLSLGNSEGTGGKDLTGELVVVKNKQEFDELPDEKVKGKIILFNYPFRQEFVSTGHAYGDAAMYRSRSASWVAKRGGKAAIVRSMASNFDDIPHTGAMRYDKEVPEKIPAIAIGVTTADELEKISKTQKIWIKLNSNCKMNGEKLTHNVIGEITGKKDQQVIVAGGHLDSWDVGEGAHDDGAGIVQAIEILRTFKNLKLYNNHTIRVVCFANEENGVRGGNLYAKEAKEKNETHVFAIESDGGGFTPRGIALVMDDKKVKQIQSWRNLFEPYGVYDFTGRYAGTDIEPMQENSVPLAELVPDSQRYFEIHHTQEDTFEKVNRRELLLGAVAMTQLLYMIDKNW